MHFPSCQIIYLTGIGISVFMFCIGLSGSSQLCGSTVLSFIQLLNNIKKETFPILRTMTTNHVAIIVVVSRKQEKHPQYQHLQSKETGMSEPWKILKMFLWLNYSRVK